MGVCEGFATYSSRFKPKVLVNNCVLLNSANCIILDKMLRVWRHISVPQVEILINEGVNGRVLSQIFWPVGLMESAIMISPEVPSSHHQFVNDSCSPSEGRLLAADLFVMCLQERPPRPRSSFQNKIVPPNGVFFVHRCTHRRIKVKGANRDPLAPFYEVSLRLDSCWWCPEFQSADGQCNQGHMKWQ